MLLAFPLYSPSPKAKTSDLWVLYRVVKRPITIQKALRNERLWVWICCFIVENGPYHSVKTREPVEYQGVYQGFAMTIEPLGMK